MVKTFIQALIDAGYEPCSYSGRGMYGKQCTAIVTDDHAFKVGLLVCVALPDDYPTYKLENVNEDSMGRSTVLYWPAMEWPADMEDEG